MPHTVLLWSLFGALVISLLALDLGVFHRKAHVIRIKEALIWSAAWIAVALIFNIFIYLWQGRTAALEFLTGYLLEKSLSIDNLFVFLLIFSYFKVDPKDQHKVLFWGIVGALIMRAMFIVAGITLLNKFHWVIYLFGGLLVVTGIKMALGKDKEIHPNKNPVIGLFRRLFRLSDDYEGSRFAVRRDGRLFLTPLFAVLIVIETTDVIFAVDSVPAVLAITVDPFVVYTSNIFAILGLRALYFALAGMMKMFHYLHYGLSFILIFVGVKMIVSGFYKVPVGVALSVVASTLAVSIAASMIWPQKGGECRAKNAM